MKTEITVGKDCRIMIGDQIVVTIVKVGEKRCRIGVDSPRDLSVMRGELVKR